MRWSQIVTILLLTARKTFQTTQPPIIFYFPIFSRERHHTRRSSKSRKHVRDGNKIFIFTIIHIQIREGYLNFAEVPAIIIKRETFGPRSYRFFVIKSTVPFRAFHYEEILVLRSTRGTTIAVSAGFRKLVTGRYTARVRSLHRYH